MRIFFCTYDYEYIFKHSGLCVLKVFDLPSVDALYDHLMANPKQLEELFDWSGAGYSCDVHNDEGKPTGVFGCDLDSNSEKSPGEQAVEYYKQRTREEFFRDVESEYGCDSFIIVAENDALKVMDLLCKYDMLGNFGRKDLEPQMLGPKAATKTE